MPASSMRRTCSITAAFLLAFFCLPCFPALLSARTVTVFGTVRNPSEKSIPLALVRFISGTDTTTALTDSAGCYSVELTTEPAVGVDDHPSGFTLGQNYPNPFNPSTVIEYTLPAPTDVRLDIYSISGQKIRTLVDGHEDAGNKTVRWDGRDQRGNGAAAGVYLYRLHAGKFVQTRKMLLLDGGSGSFIAKPARKVLHMEQTSLSYTIEVKKTGFQTWRENCQFASDASVIEKNVSMVQQFLKISRYPTRNYRVTAGNQLSVQVYGISAPVSNEKPIILLVSAAGDSEKIQLDPKYYRFEEVSGVEPYQLLSDDPTSGPLLLIGYFPTADSTATPGDGILQVNSIADTISAEYYSSADGDIVHGTLTIQKYRQEKVDDTVYENVNGYWVILVGDIWCPMAPNSFFVRFTDVVSQEAIDSLNNRLGVTVMQIHTFSSSPHYISYYLRIPDGADLLDIMKAYADEEIVQSVWPNAVGSLCKI